MTPSAILAQVPAAHRGGMHLVEVSSPTVSLGDPGSGSFLVAVGGALVLLGALLGGCITAVACLCCRGRPSQRHLAALNRVLLRWEALAKKASFFVGRRRRLALAVGAYRFSDLRESVSSRPNQARARRRTRQSTPAHPLQEGPAIRERTCDGSHRARA